MNILIKILILLIPAVLISAFCYLWLLWGANEYNIFKYITGNNLKTDFYQTTGTWGDTFGALNTLISAFGFVGIITTILIQYVSNYGQKLDLHKQRFETSIFEQIRLIRETREEIIFIDPVSKIKFTGREATRQVEKYLRNAIIEYGKKSGNIAITQKRVAAIYTRGFHSRFESRVGAFFRVVYYTFDKIRSDKFLTDEEKRNYGNLIRGQLTSADAAVLGVNALTEYSKDLSEIVIYFRLLRYTRNSILRKNLERFYPKETFMPRN